MKRIIVISRLQKLSFSTIVLMNCVLLSSLSWIGGTHGQIREPPLLWKGWTELLSICAGMSVSRILFSPSSPGLLPTMSLLGLISPPPFLNPIFSVLKITRSTAPASLMLSPPPGVVIPATVTQQLFSLPNGRKPELPSGAGEKTSLTSPNRKPTARLSSIYLPLWRNDVPCSQRRTDFALLSFAS